MGSNCYKLCSNVFRFQFRIPVFQKHFNHFTEILVKLIERLALRMCTRESWNKPNEQTCVRTFFDDSCE